MNTHSQRLLDSISSACENYRTRKITVDTLQLMVAGNLSAFDIDAEVNQRLSNVFDEFDGRLEVIQFMHPKNEEYVLVCDAINVLLSSLHQVLQ